MRDTQVGEFRVSAMDLAADATVHLAALVGAYNVPTTVVGGLDVPSIGSQIGGKNYALPDAYSSPQSLQRRQKRVIFAAGVCAGHRRDSPQRRVSLSRRRQKNQTSVYTGGGAAHHVHYF